MAVSGSTASPIRAGVIGLGMGRHHVTAFKQAAGCQVTAVCDPDAKRLAQVVAEHQVAHTYASAEELIHGGQVDVVAIASPNFLHHPQTLVALEAGLHVICEKPLALNAKLAEEMVRAARQHKRKLAVHFNHRMTAHARTIARYCRQGMLGEVYFSRIVWHRRRGIPSGWFLQKKTSGGGCLIDLGVHMLDSCLFALGHPKVVSVVGQTQNRFGAVDASGRAMDVEDFVTAYLRTAGGAVIAMEISWASHHEHPEQMILAIYGDKGGIVRRSEHYQDRPLEVTRREGDLLTTTRLDTLDPGLSVHQDFIEAIRQDREPLCSGEHGVEVMRIIDAIYESSRTGREVRLKA